MQDKRRLSNLQCRFNPHPRRSFFVLVCFLSLGTYSYGEMTAEPARPANAVQETQRSRPPIVEVFDINTKYGTVTFRGAVERTELPGEFEFLAQINVTFTPDKDPDGGGPVNQTEIVDLRFCELVATIWSGKKEPAEVLYRESHPVAIRLTKNGEAAQLPDLRFRVSKSIAARATHIGLGVTDGKLLWPIAVELK
jgi:hypothetical protein